MAYLNKIFRAHKRIMDAMKQKKMSPYKLALLSGLTYPTVHRFVNKKNLNITMESYFKMCAVLGID